MNKRIRKDIGKISLAMLSGLLMLVAAGVSQEAVSQNATTTDASNQTGMAMQDQTSSPLANLTRADFGPIVSALSSARDSLMQNATQDAYFSLNFADNALFRTALDEGPSATGILIEMSQPVRNHIENAQKALLDGDVLNSLNELNVADVELLKITEGLPAGEEEPSEDE